jgi:hypothetical protein
MRKAKAMTRKYLKTLSGLGGWNCDLDSSTAFECAYECAKAHKSLQYCNSL